MKRFFLLAAFLVATPSLKADIHHVISASASLTTTAAATQATRVGSSFSISGTGVDTAIGDNAGQLSAGTITSGIYSPGTVVSTQNATGGESFSFSSTYLQGDSLQGGDSIQTTIASTDDNSQQTIKASTDYNSFNRL